MTVTRIKRVINPARKAAKRRPNPRKLTLKQIKAGFGGARRKANAKRRVAPRKKAAVHRTQPRKQKRRRPNPAPLLLTVGAVNPQRKAKAKGKKKVAKSQKRSLAAKKAARTRKRRASMAIQNPRRHRRPNSHRRPVAHRNHRNGTRIYVVRKNGRRRMGHRNPQVMGISATQIAAGLFGVYAVKTATPIVANMAPQFASSPIALAILQGALAWGGGMLLGMWKPEVGKGFAVGGLMQAGGTLLNLVVPGNPISAASGISGLGDFAPAMFPVPQNPIQAAAQQRALASAAATPKRSGVGAVAAFR